MAKYDEEAFGKAWDYPESSSSDGEDNSSFHFSFFDVSPPAGIGGRNTAILGPIVVFFSAVRPHG